MKQTYETPEILLAPVNQEDVIRTSSGGDTPSLFDMLW